MWLAYAQLAASMVLVGLNVPLVKILGGALPVSVLLLARCALGAATLLPFTTRRWPPRAATRNLLIQAAVGTLLYNGALVAGLRLTGALDAGLMLAALPAAVALGASVLLHERLTRRGWVAIAAAGTGVATLALTRATDGASSLLGNALILLAVCGEAGYVLLARHNAGRMRVIDATFWMQLFSALLAAPFALLAWGGAAWSWPIAGLLAFHSLTASVLAVLLWFRGLQRVPAGTAGVFTGLLPLTAAALAIAALGERPTALHAAAAALLLGSIALATWPAHRLT